MYKCKITINKQCVIDDYICMSVSIYKTLYGHCILKTAKPRGYCLLELFIRQRLKCPGRNEELCILTADSSL